MALPVGTRRRLFDVEEYFRMGEAGILDEDDRVELIDGEVIEMAAVGGPLGARCVSPVPRAPLTYTGTCEPVSIL